MYWRFSRSSRRNGYVFETFLEIPKFWGVILGCGTLIIYKTLGGIRAVLITEVVQFILLALGLPLVLVFGVMAAGGIEAVISGVPASHFHIPGPLSWVALISLFLTFMFGEALAPPYLQRLLIGKDIHQMVRGTLWSVIKPSRCKNMRIRREPNLG